MANTPNWASLRHYYGEASDIPGLLGKLIHKSRAVRERAWEGLEVRTQQLGGVYEATPHVLSYARQLLLNTGYPDRLRAAGYLWGATLILSEASICIKQCPFSGLDMMSSSPELPDSAHAAIYDALSMDSWQFAALSADEEIPLQGFAAEIRRFCLFTDGENATAGLNSQAARHPAIRMLSKLYCLSLGLSESGPHNSPCSTPDQIFDIVVACVGLDAPSRAGRLAEAIGRWTPECEATTTLIADMYGIRLRDLIDYHIHHLSSVHQWPLWCAFLGTAENEDQAHEYAEFALRALFSDTRTGWPARVPAVVRVRYEGVPTTPIPTLSRASQSELRTVLAILYHCDLLWPRRSRLWSLFGLPDTRDGMSRLI